MPTGPVWRHAVRFRRPGSGVLPSVTPQLKRWAQSRCIGAYRGRNIDYACSADCSPVAITLFAPKPQRRTFMTDIDSNSDDARSRRPLQPRRALTASPSDRVPAGMY